MLGGAFGNLPRIVCWLNMKLPENPFSVPLSLQTSCQAYNYLAHEDQWTLAGQDHLALFGYRHIRFSQADRSIGHASTMARRDSWSAPTIWGDPKYEANELAADDLLVESAGSSCD